jgi:hypothetical protein
MSGDWFKSTLSALAESLGLGGLTFSPEGDSCLLAFDDFEVSVNYLAKADLALIFTVVGPLPGDSAGRNALNAALLDANTLFHKTQGFTLAASETTGITLQSCQPMQQLDKERLSAWIRNLLDVAEYWQSVCLEHHRSGKGQDTPRNPSAPDTNMLRI